MASNTSHNQSVSVLEDGKVRPGVYMIQNALSHTFVDILDTKELCCRPESAIPGKGLWEIRLVEGDLYTIRTLTKDQPEEFCTVMIGETGMQVIKVAPSKGAWMFVPAEGYDDRDGSYFRISWGETSWNWTFDKNSSDGDIKPIQLMPDDNFEPVRIWKLIPLF